MSRRFVMGVRGSFAKNDPEAGIVPQTERREPYKPTQPVELLMGETEMALFPDDGFKITCTSSDKAGRFTQFYSLDINPKSWEKELANARTFCFFEEIEYLIKNGLIRGGSLENAVVIRDDAVLTTEPLRYPEEFVRQQDAGYYRGRSRCRGGRCRAFDRGEAKSRGVLRDDAVDPGADAKADSRGTDGPCHTRGVGCHRGGNATC